MASVLAERGAKHPWPETTRTPPPGYRASGGVWPWPGAAGGWLQAKKKNSLVIRKHLPVRPKRPRRRPTGEPCSTSQRAWQKRGPVTVALGEGQAPIAAPWLPTPRARRGAVAGCDGRASPRRHYCHRRPASSPRRSGLLGGPKKAQKLGFSRLAQGPVFKRIRAREN
jgi:hypothetical protein